MSIFIDTSAIYALMDADDKNHPKAKLIWERLVSGRERLVSTNYVVVELFTLLFSRLGLSAARGFQESVYPIISVQWVDDAAHQAGVSGVLLVGRRKLSLVDCTSFETMRRLGLKSVFTFDRHFKDQDFDLLP